MPMDMDYNSILSGINGQNGRGMNSLLAPRSEVPQVDGEAGAWNLAVGPNSTVFALDRTQNLIVWFIKTDQLGNKELVSGFTLSPYVPKQPPDFDKIQSMLESVSQKLDQQANRYDALEQKVTSLEEAFK